MFTNQRLKTAATFAAGLVAGCILMGGLWIAEQPGNAAPSAAKSFRDVPANHWAAKSVANLKAKRIIQGEPDAAYSGNQFVTRYEAAVLIDRFVTYVEDGRKPLRATTLDPSKMPQLKQGFAYKAQDHLARSKFAAPDSPLFTGSGNAPLTAKDFTTIIAQAVNRISDRAVAPSAQPED